VLFVARSDTTTNDVVTRFELRYAKKKRRSSLRKGGGKVKMERVHSSARADAEKEAAASTYARPFAHTYALTPHNHNRHFARQNYAKQGSKSAVSGPCRISPSRKLKLTLISTPLLTAVPLVGRNLPGGRTVLRLPYSSVSSKLELLPPPIRAYHQQGFKPS
jgi:hypothetical protein